MSGVGIGVIGQSNYVEVDGFDNGAFANTGGNAQFSGPQVNITGQLALAGAQGGGALSLGLIGAGAFGGDADSAAANAADSSSWQQVANNLIDRHRERDQLAVAHRDAGEQQRRQRGWRRGRLLAPFSTRARSTSPTVRWCSRSATLPSRTAATTSRPSAARRMSRCRSRLTAPQAGGSAALAFGGAVAVDGDADRRGREHLGQRQHHAGNQRHDDGRCDGHQPGSGGRDPGQPQRGRRDLSRSLARTDRGGGAAAPPPGLPSSSLSTWRHPAESRQQRDECESKTSGGGSPSRRSDCGRSAPLLRGGRSRGERADRSLDRLDDRDDAPARLDDRGDAPRPTRRPRRRCRPTRRPRPPTRRRPRRPDTTDAPDTTGAPRLPRPPRRPRRRQARRARRPLRTRHRRRNPMHRRRGLSRSTPRTSKLVRR